VSGGQAIVALAPQDWHGQWVNRQHLLSRVGRNHTVLYSTGGWFVWDRRSDEWRRAPWGGRLQEIDNVRVDESPRWLMRWPRFPLWDRAVMRLQVRRWIAALRRVAPGPLIAYICHPSFFPYVNLIGADRIVYHVYDLYDHQPNWTSELDRHERELLKRADLVFCPSEMLAQALREKVERPVEVLPNAANVALFFEATACSVEDPPDLREIARPRIGWIGSLHPQVDYGLIAALARRRPDWNFVFVGGKVAHVEEPAEREYQECRSLPNVHFLGYKHRDEIPAYVVNMDVHLLCYRMSDASWVKVAYPLKLHECLASGRPLVSSDLQMLRVHSDVIRFASGLDEWETAIAHALAEGGVGTPDERRAAARNNSWDVRAQQLSDWLAGLDRDRHGGEHGVNVRHGQTPPAL